MTQPETTLANALTLLATKLNLPPADLMAYANEDPHGGVDTGYSGMSIHCDEGRVLYALVRALKPQHAIEIGVCEGVSTLHLLAALDANGQGVLDGYDLDPHAGKHIPTSAARWTFHAEDALDADYPPAEFVFEDAAHTLDFSLAIYAHLKALEPRVLVVHDYYTDEVYGNFYVRQAFESVFGAEAFGVKLHDCFRGLGVWVNPNWREPAPPEPARKPAARKATPAKRTAKR